MRSLMRNRRPVQYCNFVRTEFEENEQGKKTGKKKTVYGDVKTIYVTVSAPNGSVTLAMFGTDENYEKTLVLDKTDIDINENSVLWVDKPYSIGVAHDYIVRKVIRNRNFLFVGIKKVNVAYESGS